MPPAATSCSSGTFTRCMSELCIHTTLEYLSVDERLTCSEVSHIFSSSVHHPALWRRFIYECDGEFSSHRTIKPPPRSPFSSQSESILLLTLPMPPLSIRSLLRGFDLRECSPDEVIQTLPRLTQTIRSLSITIMMPAGIRADMNKLSESIRIALRGLQLESLEVIDADWSFTHALFGVKSTVRQSQQQLPIPEGIDGIHAYEPVYEWDAEPVIWSYSSTLNHLSIIESEEKGLYCLLARPFFTAMSESQWPRLKRLQCPMLRYTDLGYWLDLRTVGRLFTSDRLPQVTHLDVGAGFTTDEEMCKFYSFFEKLPNLTALRTRSYTTSNDRGNIITFPPALRQLHFDNSRLQANGIARLTFLTRLVFLETFIKSVDLFSIIGHHNLPHLAELWMRSCRDEELIAACASEDSDSEEITVKTPPLDYMKVLDLMSTMTSLTSLGCDYVHHSSSHASTTHFNWFLHLYRFPSLRYISYCEPRGAMFRHEPLPLPSGITLTPNQHPLYPQGSIHFTPMDVGIPSSTLESVNPSLWIGVDLSIVNREGQLRFSRPNPLKYLDKEQFRLGAQKQQECEAATAKTVSTAMSDSSSNKISPGRFIAIMTDLCIVTMLQYLYFKERIRFMSVSRHAHHSVMHTGASLWRHVTYETPSYENALTVSRTFQSIRIDGAATTTGQKITHNLTSAEATKIREHCAKVLSDATRLPSSQMRFLIGGIRLSSRELYLVQPFPSLKRLSLADEAPLYKIDHLDAQAQSEIHAALASLRLEHLTLHLGYSPSSQRFDHENRPRSAHAFHGIITKKAIEVGFSQVVSSSLAGPLIFNYVDSLRRLHLTIAWGTGTRIIDSFSSRIWSQLDTLKLDYRTCSSSVFGATFTDDLPFEELLTHAKTALPLLTSLDISIRGSTYIDPSSSLIRIFTALDEAPTLLSLKYSFALVSVKNSQFIYPRSLTSLALENQAIDWMQMKRLSALTDLRLNATSATTSLQLFESIGHSSMPHLRTLAIESHPHKYESSEKCAIERVLVCQLMSEMSALTELYIPHAQINTDPMNTFCWFDHISLFSSLTRIEYNLDGQFFHTLQPIPPTVAAMAQSADSNGSSLSELFFNLDHPLLPHLATPVWRHSPITHVEGEKTFTVINLAAQPECEWSSPDEIRILQQRQYETKSLLPRTSPNWVSDTFYGSSDGCSSYDRMKLYSPLTHSTMFPALTDTNRSTHVKTAAPASPSSSSVVTPFVFVAPSAAVVASPPLSSVPDLSDPDFWQKLGLKAATRSNKPDINAMEE